MHYLIDGYNLFFKLEKNLLPLKEKRAAFIDLFNETMRQIHFQALIVFDSGYKNSAHFASKQKLSNIEVSFSPQHLSADQYILELLEWNSKNTILVTSDRQLSKKGAFLGAKTLSIEAFVDLIFKKQKKQRPNEKLPLGETKESFERLYKVFKKKLDENSG